MQLRRRLDSTPVHIDGLVLAERAVVLARLALVTVLVGGCAADAIPLAAPRPVGSNTPDAGASSPEAGASSIDAGVSSSDSGASPHDSGASSPDAGPAATSTYLVAASSFGAVLLDLSDPAAPVEVSSADSDAAGNGDEPLPLYALTADDRGQVFAGRLGGIDAYRIERGQLTARRGISIGGVSAFGVDAADGRLYAALGPDGVRIFDVSGEARLVGTIPAQRGIYDVRALDGGYVALYDGHDPALWIYDVSDPARPALVSVEITDFVTSVSRGMAASGGFVAANVVSFGSSALWFWDARDPTRPVSLGFHPDVRAPSGRAVSLWSNGVEAFGYFAGQEDGVVIAEASLNRRQPRSGRISTLALDTAIHANVLYVATDGDGVGVYTISPDRPEAPERARTATPLAMGADRLAVVLTSEADAD